MVNVKILNFIHILKGMLQKAAWFLEKIENFKYWPSLQIMIRNSQKKEFKHIHNQKINTIDKANAVKCVKRIDLIPTIFNL